MYKAFSISDGLIGIEFIVNWGIRIRINSNKALIRRVLSTVGRQTQKQQHRAGFEEGLQHQRQEAQQGQQSPYGRGRRFLNAFADEDRVHGRILHLGFLILRQGEEAGKKVWGKWGTPLWCKLTSQWDVSGTSKRILNVSEGQLWVSVKGGVRRSWVLKLCSYTKQCWFSFGHFFFCFSRKGPALWEVFSLCQSFLEMSSWAQRRLVF